MKIGWYRVEESFDEDGIDIAICDRRTNETIAFQVETFEDYDSVIAYLDENRQLGTLSRLNDSVQAVG